MYIKSIEKTGEEMEYIKEISPVSPVNPEEVFAFEFLLADSQVDDENEKLSLQALQSIKMLFKGKSGKVCNLPARIYDTENRTINVREPKKNHYCLTPQQGVMAKAFIIITEENATAVAAIKEIIENDFNSLAPSISFSFDHKECSICGSKRSYTENCAHRKGKKYMGAICVDIISSAVEAYGWSIEPRP